MEEDWQENLWETDRDNNDDEDTAAYYRGSDDESGDEEVESDNEEETNEAEGELDFKPDFKQLSHTSKGGSNMVDGVSKRLQKSMRSPLEATMEQARGIISSSPYDDLSETKREKALALIEGIYNVHLYHLEILVPAAIWKVNNNSLERKNFQNYVKQYSLDETDLLRYIRLLD
jgi:hypothetical protein